MQIGTMFKNGALESTKELLSNNPKALKIAASVFDKVTGTTQERLLIALETAIVSLKEKVEPLELPSNLEEKTCAWLRDFAEENDILCLSSDRKADLIAHIRHEASNRKFFS
jgi:hypothetical protein